MVASWRQLWQPLWYQGAGFGPRRRCRLGRGLFSPVLAAGRLVLDAQFSRRQLCRSFICGRDARTWRHGRLLRPV